MSDEMRIWLGIREKARELKITPRRCILLLVLPREEMCSTISLYKKLAEKGRILIGKMFREGYIDNAGSRDGDNESRYAIMLSKKGQDLRDNIVKLTGEPDQDLMLEFYDKFSEISRGNWCL